MPKRRKLSFKKGSKGERKRSEIAEAIKRDDPGISDDSKFAIATAAAKKHFRRKGHRS